MKAAGRAVAVIVCLAWLAWGQSRQDIINLNRDIALLEERVRAFQKTTEERLKEILDAAGRSADASANISAAIDKSLRGRLDEQQKSLAAMGSKVDDMAAEFQVLRETVAAMNSRLSKIEQQIADIATALRTLQAPPAPPSADGAAAGGLAAGILFQNALHDKEGGSYDLALRGFREYLDSYGSTPQAPAAQYYIGEILYRQGKYKEAKEAFDLVLERYPDNERTADAQYMKGLALVRMGARSEAIKEFNALLKRLPPKHELAAQASEQLRLLQSSSAPKKSRK